MIGRMGEQVTHENLRTALAGAADAPLVLLGNFEVENQWAAGEAGLPKLAMTESKVIVNRMDEFALLLASPSDYVLLKAMPDPGYLAYLGGRGLALPTSLAPRRLVPRRTVTEDALADRSLLAVLSALPGARLWPHGVAAAEEQLAAATGIPLALPSAAVCKAVNSKIYSRQIATELGLRQPPGLLCRNLGELAYAWDEARKWQEAGRTVGCKDAYGVSGKGIVVLRDGRALDQLCRMVVRQAERSGREELGLVFETWVEKQADLNYQFTVRRNGEVTLDFVKEAVTEGGVHRGHWMPADLSAAEVDELRQVAVLLGGRLAEDGYFGVAGVDALMGSDRRLYPVIEINARNNMSTYQERLRHTLIGPACTALATHYPIRLPEYLPFEELATALGDVMFNRATRAGLLVNNFATVNAGATLGAPNFEGRLYGVVVAESRDRARSFDEEIKKRTAAITPGV